MVGNTHHEADPKSTIVLENKKLRATFHATTGAMLSLTAVDTGWCIARPPGDGLSFRLLAPTAEGRNTFVDGRSVECSSIQVSEDGGSLELVWANPPDNRQQTVDLTLQAKVSLTDQWLQFDGVIENRSDRTIEAVAWPSVGGLQPSQPERTLLRRQMQRMGFSDAGLYPTLKDNQGYWGTYYPTESGASSVHSLFVLIEEEEQGLYVGCHDKTARRLVKWFFQQTPGLVDSYDLTVPQEGSPGLDAASLELLVQQFCFVSPGDSAELSTIALAPYQGSWHAGADLYKRWRRDWYRPPSRPEWIENVHSWLQIQIYGAEDEINFRYTDLPQIASQCKESGIQAIQLTGWADGGQDRGNPSHEVDQALGTRDELTRAIEQCEEMGVRIILFCKWTWIDQGRPDYPDLERHTAKNAYGYPYPAGGYKYYTPTQLAGINTRPLVPTCTASPDWQAAAVAEFEKVVSLGSSGMLFDEVQHHGGSHYCFDTEHDHPQPAYLYAHDCELARAFKKAGAGVSPKFLYAGELCTDIEMTEYQLLYTRFERGHVPAMRYVDPSMPIMMAATGFDDRNKLNRCLEYRYIVSYEPFNFKGRPHDAPLTIAYGRMVDDLRRRYRSLLWDGDFLGAQGAVVRVDGQASRDFSVHVDRNTRQRAVAVCNTDGTDAVKVEVALPGSRGNLMTVTPETPEPTRMDGTFTLAPRSVVVVLEGLCVSSQGVNDLAPT